MRRRFTELAVIGGLVLLVLAALGVASGDVVRIWNDGPSTVTVPDGVELVEADDDEIVEPSAVEALPPDEPTDALLRIVAIIGAALLAWLFIVVAVTWWRIWRERSRWPSRMGPATTLEPLDPPPLDLQPDELVDTLRDGEPRNAIVACWVRLEEAVAAAGHPRRPAETSLEYTERVLADTSDLDPDAVRRLAELYREARFSSHPLGEAQRMEALAALATVTR